MFNYRDLPVVEWDGSPSVDRLLCYLRAGEAFVLSFAETSLLHIEPSRCDCAEDLHNGVCCECDAGKVLRTIAENNHLNAIEPVIEATIAAGARADIDPGQRRVVIYLIHSTGKRRAP